MQTPSYIGGEVFFLTHHRPCAQESFWQLATVTSERSGGRRSSTLDRGAHQHSDPIFNLVVRVKFLLVKMLERTGRRRGSVNRSPGGGDGVGDALTHHNAFSTIFYYVAINQDEKQGMFTSLISVTVLCNFENTLNSFYVQQKIGLNFESVIFPFRFGLSRCFTVPYPCKVRKMNW